MNDEVLSPERERNVVPIFLERVKACEYVHIFTILSVCEHAAWPAG